MPSRVLNEEEQKVYHKTEMASLADVDIRSLAHPVADTHGVVCRAEQWLIALGRDLGDRYESREAMRHTAHQLLAPRAHSDFVKSVHVYHLLGEYVPSGSFDDADRLHAAQLLHAAEHRAANPLSCADVRSAIRDAGSAALDKLNANRVARELKEESVRAAASNRVNECRQRFRRIRDLAPVDGGGAAEDATHELPAGGSSKFAALLALVREHVLNGPIAGKAVVFTRFGEAVSHVGAFLESEGIGTVSLRPDSWWRHAWRGDGARPGVTTFRCEDKCRVLLLEADASAAGLTLTCARHVIFLDVLNSSLLEEQAKARVNRIGQKQKTHVWHLIAADSVDEPLRAAADRKAPITPGDGKPEAVLHILHTAAQRSEDGTRKSCHAPDEDQEARGAAGVGDGGGAEAVYPRVRLKLASHFATGNAA